jgi:hypothetical protein
MNDLRKVQDKDNILLSCTPNKEKLEFKETAFQKKQKENLMNNILFLSEGEFKRQCPTAFKNVGRKLDYLVRFHHLAMNNIRNKYLTDKSGAVAFFASTSYICKKTGISPNRLGVVSDRNAFLAYHGLLNKLDENEIPEEMLKRSKEIVKNSSNPRAKMTNVYSFPSYADKAEEIESQAIKWRENNYTMKGTSWEMFFRAEGEEVANTLYPQYKTRVISEASHYRNAKIVMALYSMIEAKGYATEKEIVKALTDDYRYIVTEIQLKRSLKELLDAYGLVRIRANKALKEKYNIMGKGYPYIIVYNG